MKQFLLIGLGGFLGSISRYGVHLLCAPLTDKFPSGTLIANIAGSLLIGILVGLSIKNDQAFYWFAGIGFCGGFTTFSTFALEGSKLIKNDMWLSFAGYFSVSILGGLMACFLGIWLGSKIT